MKGFKRNLQHCSEAKRTKTWKCFSLYCRIELTICHKKTVGDSYRAIGVTTNRCNEISFLPDFGYKWNVPNVPSNTKKNSRSVKPVWNVFPSLVMAKSCYTRNGPIVCPPKSASSIVFERWYENLSMTLESSRKVLSSVERPRPVSAMKEIR